MSWIFIFIAMLAVFIFIQPTARRGFGKRWSIIMLLWAPAWTSAALLTPSLTVLIFLYLAFPLLDIS